MQVWDKGQGSILGRQPSHLVNREEENVQSTGKRNTDMSCTEVKFPVRQPVNLECRHEPGTLEGDGKPGQ